MEITMNAVNMVPVEWLMKNLTDSVDRVDICDDLFDLFREKATDSGFGYLIESIIDNGFTTPICVQNYYPGRFTQGNGHHRLAAAILLCLDEIPVYFTDTDDYMCSHVTEGGRRLVDSCSPDINMVWRKLIYETLFDAAWCDRHNEPLAGCFGCWWDARKA